MQMPLQALSEAKNRSDSLLSVEKLAIDIPGDVGVLHPVREVSFQIARGEALALVGESGCGKSMVASALLRLLPEGAITPSGRVELLGRELLSLTEFEMREIRGGVAAMVFQEPSTSFDPVMTIGAQIEEMILAHKVLSKSEARRRALHWLQRVGMPDPERAFRSYPHELSGGLKQRAMIAMALSADPALLIADEPTTALDVTLQRQVLDLLVQLKRERGLALLFITHDLALLPGIADRVALMYAGKIVETASVETFLAAPMHPYARALLAALPSDKLASGSNKPLRAIPGIVLPVSAQLEGCAFAERCPIKRAQCLCHMPRLERRSDGLGSVACWATSQEFLENAAGELKEEKLSEVPRPSAPTLVPVLSLQALRVRTAPAGLKVSLQRAIGRTVGREILHDVSFALERGRTLALVGESGSGKTTTALALLGLLSEALQASGKVRLEASSGTFSGDVSLPRSSTFRRAVQVVFQDPFSSLDPRMTVGEILTEPLRALRPELSEEARQARIEALLQETGLPREAKGRLPHEFSGGQRQRIAIARALAPEPEVVVLDEPTSALDVSVQAQILNLLAQLQRTRGLAYLLITHNFAVVANLAHRVAVMREGKLVEVGETAEVLGHPRSEYARHLIASVPRLSDVSRSSSAT